MAWFDGFEATTFKVNGVEIFARIGGPADAPPLLLLLHGYPQTHASLASRGARIEPEALAEYERCFARPDALHASCEDFRASAGIDLAHDRASRAAGEKIVCDTLVLWGERGVVHKLFEPLRLWQAQCAAQVNGAVMPAGHFIPEELPVQTAQHVQGFFA